MGKEWISMEDETPRQGERVWYYFSPDPEFVILERGTYDYWEEDGKYPCHTFGSGRGWLTNDVTHWRSDRGELEDEVDVGVPEGMPLPRRMRNG
jgi:hypothetical protein